MEIDLCIPLQGLNFKTVWLAVCLDVMKGYTQTQIFYCCVTFGRSLSFARTITVLLADLIQLGWMALLCHLFLPIHMGINSASIFLTPSMVQMKIEDPQTLYLQIFALNTFNQNCIGSDW